MSGGPEPIEWDLYEPNNSFAAATNLGTTNTFSLAGLTLHNSPATDVDYFKFTAPSNANVGVAIEFLHQLGNLQLTAYNAQQQQIAHSNSSTHANGREGFALNLAAGQTYFIKVSGAAAGVSQPDYWLGMDPLSVTFDWTMPRRFGNQLDQWGLPIIPNTRDYARPNPVIVDGQEVPSFPVRVDAAGSNLGSNDVVYQWVFESPNFTRSVTSTIGVAIADLPEGQYTATLQATANGTTLTTTRTVNVVDHLIVSVGDSYGSGEGNPHRPQQYDFLGFTTSGAKWAQGLDDAITASHRRAHRSAWAGVVQAALGLENADPKSSVTFVFLNHSGATMQNGVLGPQDSIEVGEPGSDPAQLEQMEAIVGYRRVDALVLSVGGNDAGFFDIASRLVEADPQHDGSGYQAKLNQIWADADAYRQDLVDDHLPDLEQQMHWGGRNIGQVFLTEYPDPTRDSSGGTATQILHDIADGYEIDFFELNEVRSRVMAPLGQAMAKFAREESWCYVTDIASAFGTHGYGDWFRTASDSVVLQGPLDNRNFISPEDRAATKGTLHPIGGGLDVQRDRINAALTMPNLVATTFQLTPFAFVSDTQNGYRMIVRNLSVTGNAGPSVARIYLSSDPTLTANDHFVLDVNVPAIPAGGYVDLEGVLPVFTNPLRSPSNIEYVAPVVDFNNSVAESVEADNTPLGVWALATIRPERDITALDGNNFVFSGGLVGIGPTYNPKLGLDEFVGEYDIDLFAVDINGPQWVSFDLDSTSPTNLDTHLRIYPMTGDTVHTGELLASNDNGRAPDEPSTQNGESYLQYAFGAPGRYCIVVAHAANGATNPMQIASRVAGAKGQYSMQLKSLPTTPPAVLSSSFDVNTRTVQVTFRQDVRHSLDSFDVELTNLTTGQTGLSNNVSSQYDAGTDTTTAVFALDHGWLSNGNHRALIRRGSVRNLSNIPMSQDHTSEFHVLSADVNRDRYVNIDDQIVIGSHMGQSGQTFTNGDVNYDGYVDSADMAIFDAANRQWLPPQGAQTMSGWDEIRLKNESASLVELYLEGIGPDPIVYRVFRGAVSAWDFNTFGGEDVLKINLSNGSPVPAGGISYNGGAGNDAVYVIGVQGGHDSVTFSSNGATFGGGPGSLSNVDVETLVFDGRGGYDDLTVNAGASVILSSTQWFNSLNVQGTVNSPSDPILGLSMVTRALTIGPNAKLDLNENDLILDYTGASPLDDVQSLISSARAGGDWTGNGITSDSARIRPASNTTLGAMEASAFKSVYGDGALFDGQAIDSTAVLVKYTYYGDTDFSGSIDGDDYSRLDNGFNLNLGGWINGDADGNGFIDGDDYALIDNAFSTQSQVL
jgi:hypothetical protein